MNPQTHWDKIYTEKPPDAVSWYAPHLDTSLALVKRTALPRSARIIDVGGGESTLVDDLLARGYSHLTVLDISQAAIDASKRRLGRAAEKVQWLTADITRVELPPQLFDLWHDRAFFHFLTDPAERAACVRQVARAIKPGGHLIVSTFGPDGPSTCSGLRVARYDADSLHKEFGSRFRLRESLTQMHHTPFGTQQQFLCCWFTLE